MEQTASAQPRESRRPASRQTLLEEQQESGGTLEDRTQLLVNDLNRIHDRRVGVWVQFSDGTEIEEKNVGAGYMAETLSRLPEGKFVCDFVWGEPLRKS